MQWEIHAFAYLATVEEALWIVSKTRTLSNSLSMHDDYHQDMMSELLSESDMNWTAAQVGGLESKGCIFEWASNTQMT